MNHFFRASLNGRSNSESQVVVTLNYTLMVTQKQYNLELFTEVKLFPVFSLFPNASHTPNKTVCSY